MERKEHIRNSFWGIAIFILAIVPFVSCSAFGIINLDDYCYVSVHQCVKDGFGLQGLKWAFANVDDAIWMPLTWLSYMFDYGVVGGAPENVFNWMHIHSLVWHGLNSVLLYFFLRISLNCECKTAFIGAIFWAMHPLRVESAVWIAGRKDVISMFWLLSALILWIKWRKAESQESFAIYSASMVALVFGGMAKPSIMVFIGIVFVLDWLVLGCFKISSAGKKIKMIGRNESTNLLLPYLLPLLICLVLMISAAYAQSAGGATSGLKDMPIWARLLNAMASFGIYIRNTLWPAGLAAECQMKWPQLPRFLIPGIFVSVLCVYYILNGIRRATGENTEGEDSTTKNRILAAVLIFSGSLIPFLGIANFGAHAYADRFTYIASVGISMLVVAAIERAGQWKKAVVAALCVACIAMGCVSWNQTQYWKDDFAFWSRTAEVDGDDNIFANIGLAQYYYEYDHGNPKMLEHFRKAFKSNPAYTTGCGVLYMIGLNEAGLEKEAQNLLRYFTEWNDLMVASEREKGLLPNDRYVRRSDLDIARTAALMIDPQLRPVAKENLDRILAHKPRDKHALYLKARMAELNNDTAGMTAAYRDVLEKGEDSGEYVQYRWIKKRFTEGCK